MLPANLPDAVDEFLAAAQLDGNRVIARITPNRAGTSPSLLRLLFAAPFAGLMARRHMCRAVTIARCGAACG